MVDFPPKTFLFLSFVLINYLHSAECIKCFECNSAKEPVCADLEKTHTHSEFLKECPDAPDRRPFCRKTDLEIRLDTDAGKMHKRVIRSCGWKLNLNNKECYKKEDKDHAEQSCQCFEDFCNGSNKVTILSLSMMSLIVLIPSFL